MRMRSRWRFSVLLIMASTSLATWLMVNRQQTVTANVATSAPAPSPMSVQSIAKTVLSGLAPSTGPATSMPAMAEPTTGPATEPTTGPSTEPSGKSAPSETTTVRRGTLALTFNFDGVFEPVNPFELKLVVKRYQGDFIIRKAVVEGTHVAKGQVLLELDPQKIDEQIAMSGNDLKVATANLVKADSDVKLGDQSDALALSSAKDELADAQADLKRWDATDGPATLLSSDLQAKETQAGLDDAVDELNELKKMYKSEDLTNQTADIVMKRAARGVELQKVTNEVAKAQADRALHFVPAITRAHMVLNVTQQTQALAQLEATQAQSKVTRDAALVTARDASNEAGQKLAELKLDRAMFSITSPVDGVVAYGSFAHKVWTEIEASHFMVDEKALPDQVLMTVYTPGKMRVGAEWPETQITLLTPATRLKINPIAIPEMSYDGTAKPFGVAGEAKNDDQLFDVPIDVPEVDLRLMPGFKADVSVDAGKLDNVLLVPATAVWHGTVWLHKGDADDQVKVVTVGRTDGHEVEIKDGIVDGDVVLTQSKHAGQN